MNQMSLLASIVCLILQVELVYADEFNSKLDDARKSYFTSEKHFEQKLLDWFDSQEKRARSRGDRDAVLESKSERKEYVDNGTVPPNVPRLLLRSRKSAEMRLTREYESIIAGMTRSGFDLSLIHISEPTRPY